MKATTRQYLALLSIIVLSFGAISIVHVTAQDDNDDNEDESEDLEDDDREVSIDRSDDKVTIESETESGEREDELKIEFDTADDASIKLEYSTENDSTETEAEMDVEFFDLIEYTDDNDDGVYHPDNDTEIQTYEMSDSGYQPINYTTIELDSGATEHVIWTETNDGVFKLVLHAVGQFTNVNGTDLKPTSVKIDIIISNFDFEESDSKLALYSEVESTTEVENEDEDVDDQIEDDEEVVVQSGEGIFAFYSWKKTANVDGVITDVLASYEENTQTDQKLYLNYDQGDKIIHDPKIGVSLSSSAISDPSGVNFTSWFILAVALAVPLALKRKLGNLKNKIKL